MSTPEPWHDDETDLWVEDCVVADGVEGMRRILISQPGDPNTRTGITPEQARAVANYLARRDKT